ncbi:MAG: hypothetical protein JOZ41_17085 [Chloroflexi bacterium]|nr:hypothetical protein [Chloroflexota bacterium]
MEKPSTKDLVDDFTRKVSERLDESQLDGPVRLDNTHTVVIIPVRNRGPIHAHVQGGITDHGVDNIVRQLQAVPSLKALVKTG